MDLCVITGCAVDSKSICVNMHKIESEYIYIICLCLFKLFNLLMLHISTN